MEKIVITIARQYGSGGKTIGKMLADDVGMSYYSREILRLASDDSGIREELFNKADERLRNNPLFSSSSRVYKGGLITPDKGDFVSPDNLFNYQAKVIKDLADKESCVLVGPNGCQGKVEVNLTDEEVWLLHKSAETLKNVISQIEI